ncbi:putative bifunctional diguanylate cyclase/phosphodiesterase [Cohnella sp.]|uniref:putative bifunctional diguanylate cyclase/phosphodiesterase n=1 Tax=Cohnella sp. TaxID=1883426 RepID=UPI00356702C9
MFRWGSMIHLVKNMAVFKRSRQRELVIDEMTGLPRSKPFMIQLQMMIKQRISFHLILVRVEELKTITEHQVEAFHDELLKQISQRLLQWLPRSGSLCRLNIHDFLLYVPEENAGKVLRLQPEYLREMQTLLTDPYLIHESACHVNISTGMTTYKDEDISVEQVLSRTVTDLKLVKTQGINQIVQNREKQSKQIRERTLMEFYLGTAIKESQLTLHYQPQYDLQTGSLRGFEALLRWNHPEIGTVMPLDFIPLAEESQLIIPIGEWTLQEACRTLQQLAPSPSMLTIAVNISALQLMDELFVERVQKVLTKTGLSPNRLELELTESKLTSSFDMAERQLKKLQRLGVQLALDDFGIGYSSMDYLRKLPFNIIKIDKSFIDDIGQTHERDVTGFMIQFIKQLRYKIVAEGIESYDQLTFLKRVNCDFAQGYLFGRPMPKDQLPALIQSVNEAGNSVEKRKPSPP